MMCPPVGALVEAIVGPVLNQYVAKPVTVGLVKNRSRRYAQRHHDISLPRVPADGEGSAKALRFEGTDRILKSLLRGPNDDNQGHPILYQRLEVNCALDF